MLLDSVMLLMSGCFAHNISKPQVRRMPMSVARACATVLLLVVFVVFVVLLLLVLLLLVPLCVFVEEDDDVYHD